MPAVIQDQYLELGPGNLYIYPKTKAALTTSLTGTNNDLIIRAQRGGVAGNSITIELVDPTTNNTPLSVAVVSNAITVTLATDGASIITSTAAQVRDALNQSFASYALVYAVLSSGNDGTGLVTALASTPLVGGSDTEVETFLGALSDETSLNISASAAPLTAHLTGIQPRDKVITGGSFQIVAGLKEITLENFARAFPNAILLEGADGLKRLDFTIQAGQSLRTTRGTKMQLRKVRGNVESTDPSDILTIPEASPVDAEVNLAFSVTDQRVLTATFEAWPDSYGRVAFFGTETL
jgi:hypothetical protein